MRWWPTRPRTKEGTEVVGEVLVGARRVGEINSLRWSGLGQAHL